jgi:DNA-binding transcriptional MocR family regulator
MDLATAFALNATASWARGSGQDPRAREPVALVEEHTYFLAMKVFKDRGMRVVGVPCDDKGVLPGELRRIHRQVYDEGALPVLLYVIPTHQNPTVSALE